MKIKEKLQSSKGASLIIALVFMLFCAMVGSAVLAAATANGGRVAALKSDQQDYLNQRSAATLLQDEMSPGRPKLVITKTTTVTTRYRVGNGGVTTPIGQPATATTVNFEVRGTVKTELDRILFESAILRYIQQNKLDGYYDKNVITGFVVPQNKGTLDITSPSKFLMYNEKTTAEKPLASLSVNLSKGAVGAGTAVTEFSATVGCSGDQDNLYCFQVDFGNDTEEGMLSLRRYATVSDERTVQMQEQGPENGDESVLVKDDITIVTQTITWDSPEVMKGTVKWGPNDTKGAA